MNRQRYAGTIEPETLLTHLREHPELAADWRTRNRREEHEDRRNWWERLRALLRERRTRQ